MSDYFGALMRSSGLAIGPGPALAQRQVAEPNAFEIEVEGDSSGLQGLSGQPTPMPRQALPPVSPVQPAQQPAVAALEETASGVSDTPPMQSEGVDSAQDEQRSEAHAPTADTNTIVSAASTAVTTPKPLGHELVRAAMQWVAADPQQLRATAAPPAQQPGSPVGATPGVANALGPPAYVNESEAEGRSSSAMPAGEASPEDLALRSSDVVRPLPVPSVRLDLVPVPPPAAPSDLAEAVEISIGAIHVRVDAPAVQTVAGPAAAPPGPAPRTSIAPIPARSALARRALRRI